MDLWIHLFGNRAQLHDRPARSWDTGLTELSRLNFEALTLVNSYLTTVLRINYNHQSPKDI